MGSASHAGAHGVQGHDGPVPIDPVHDIDAKKTVIALVVSTVTVFVTVWLLLQWFSVVIFNQREARIGEAPTTQLDQLRQQESAELSGGEGRISLPDAMQKYVQR